MIGRTPGDQARWIIESELDLQEKRAKAQQDAARAAELTTAAELQSKESAKQRQKDDETLLDLSAQEKEAKSNPLYKAAQEQIKKLEIDLGIKEIKDSQKQRREELSDDAGRTETAEKILAEALELGQAAEDTQREADQAANQIEHAKRELLVELAEERGVAGNAP